MPRTASIDVAENQPRGPAADRQLLDDLGGVAVAGRLEGAHRAAALRVVEASPG